MVKFKLPRLSRNQKRVIRERWYVVPIGVIALLMAVGFARVANNELSIVKIPTEYGTLELTQNAGITQESYIIQRAETHDGLYYTSYTLSSGASVTPVSSFTEMDAANLPIGMQSGHDVLFVFDNNAATEEVLYFSVLVDIGGVEWQQVTVYSGTGKQLKVFQPPPQITAGNFFIIMYQAELERGIPSLMLQFKGYLDSQSKNVFITTFYSLGFSYIGDLPETTTEEITETSDSGFSPYFTSSIDLLYLIPIMFILVIFKRKGDKK